METDVPITPLGTGLSLHEVSMCPLNNFEVEEVYFFLLLSYLACLTTSCTPVVLPQAIDTLLCPIPKGFLRGCQLIIAFHVILPGAFAF